MKPALAATAAAFLLLVCASSAPAFQKEAGPVRDCRDCHRMTTEDAAKIFGEGVDNVVAVLPGPIPGIWEVDVQKDGKIFPVYIDYSGTYFFNGQIIRMSDRTNLTGDRYTDLNRVDLSTIPLDGAIVLGNPAAKRKIVVFSDPDCPYCAKLHGEIRKVTTADNTVAFYVRVYARNNNPATYKKAKSILCAKDPAALLDDAFEGKAIPPADCPTTAADDTARIAARLQIRGTPTMVLPDGRVIGGALPAEKILELLGESK